MDHWDVYTLSILYWYSVHVEIYKVFKFHKTVILNKSTTTHLEIHLPYNTVNWRMHLDSWTTIEFPSTVRHMSISEIKINFPHLCKQRVSLRVASGHISWRGYPKGMVLFKPLNQPSHSTGIMWKIKIIHIRLWMMVHYRWSWWRAQKVERWKMSSGAQFLVIQFDFLNFAAVKRGCKTIFWCSWWHRHRSLQIWMGERPKHFTVSGSVGFMITVIGMMRVVSSIQVTRIRSWSVQWIWHGSDIEFILPLV